MKWAIIGIVALVVLGGVGYAVYELTDAPEQAQEWWDEKRLENFETIANRELDNFEETIAEHKATLKKLKSDRIMWAGHEDWDGYEKEQETGFHTLMFYEEQIEHRNTQGQALAKAYKEYMNSDSAVINADSGEVDREAMFTVSVPQKDGGASSKEMSLDTIKQYTDKLSTDIAELEANRDRVESMVKQYDQAIVEWTNQVKVEEEQLVELRKEVKMIAAEIKLQKAKADLAELNKAINGEESDSELGSLIRKFEQKKSKFEREELVSSDEETKTSSEISLDDLDAGSSTGPSTSNRFLN